MCLHLHLHLYLSLYVTLLLPISHAEDRCAVVDTMLVRSVRGDAFLRSTADWPYLLLYFLR